MLSQNCRAEHSLADGTTCGACLDSLGFIVCRLRQVCLGFRLWPEVKCRWVGGRAMGPDEAEVGLVDEGLLSAEVVRG
jgi:hypothetical protein